MKKKSKTTIGTRLQESEMRYRRLFETARDGVLILNSETGQITDVNPFLLTLLGYSKAEFLDKKLWELGAFKNMKASKDAFEILQNQGFLRYEDLPLETKLGRLVEVEFVANSYIAGETLVIQCNIRDITERKKFEQTKEIKRLLEDERGKVQSIADATHEFRTPLAIIKGNVDLAMLDASKNPKSLKSAFRAINHEIKHLSGILVDLSLITSKAWELKNRIVYEKVALKPFIAMVVERCIVLAHKKNISITAEKIPAISLLGDKGYLEKMLVNLVRNSIIYGNKNGHTEIKVTQSKDCVVIQVIDDGIGISDEDMPYVFDRFFRAEKLTTSLGSSIGLGLAIVKWVAEIHGGTVSVSNRKNKKGTVFSVTLPIKATDNYNTPGGFLEGQNMV